MKKGLRNLKNKEFYNEYIKVFLKQNSILNLISKNDEQFLWEKHIFDSLSIEKFFEKYLINTDVLTLLDIGTGGGFPAVPIALTYSNIKVVGLDSIRKKITAIENIKSELKIENLELICDRAENVNSKFDIVTSRAVASLDKICSLALPLLKKDGYFVAYKSQKTDEEISCAQKVLTKYQAKIIDIIKYELPLTEKFVRNLIIIKK